MASMEWKEGYLDVILVPLGLLSSVLYHAWLWHKIRSQPHRTDIGVNSSGRRLWVLAMRKENGKKYMLVVQTIRNVVMASTLMATTSILLCTGLAAVISSTYSVKKPLEGSLYGARGEFVVAVKYAAMLFLFLLAFLSYTLSIRLMNEVGFLVNVPVSDGDDDADGYVCGLFDKGFLLHVVGNRLFYAGTPLLLWIFGPCLVFLCYLVMVHVMYYTDILHDGDENVSHFGDMKAAEHSHRCSIEEVA